MQWYQPELEKVQLLSEELVRSKTKTQSLQIDLDRIAEKNQKWAKKKVEGLMSGMELPQQNLSYWKFEGPKLQARVLELEMQLEQLRSQTLWKD
jgi:hypothetical protein